MSNKSIIITTINEKTKAVQEFERVLNDWDIVLVGDKKSKPIADSDKLKFLTVEDQLNTSFAITEVLPYNHYVRKNVGYLYALSKGAEVIYDTDDDNLPYAGWSFPGLDHVETEVIDDVKFYNVYNAFTPTKIWPRGYPLNNITLQDKSTSRHETVQIGAWQGLADRDPDVDAIHRLVFNKEVIFDKRQPLALNQGVYCPFNSQNTIWHHDMLPYAYLPATVTFRFTDILRGYVAQRCFWAHDRVLGFTEATVYQERNEHDLMIDFKSEIPCYLEVEKVTEIMDALKLSADHSNNIYTIYEALYNSGIVQEQELVILEAWLKDIKTILS